MSNNESKKGEIVMYQLNDVVELDVRLEDEIVWLTQAQMSQLFSVKAYDYLSHQGDLQVRRTREKKELLEKFE